jgi:hypothetical protein
MIQKGNLIAKRKNQKLRINTHPKNTKLRKKSILNLSKICKIKLKKLMQWVRKHLSLWTQQQISKRQTNNKIRDQVQLTYLKRITNNILLKKRMNTRNISKTNTNLKMIKLNMNIKEMSLRSVMLSNLTTPKMIAYKN